MLSKHSTAPWVSVSTLCILLAFASVLILSGKADKGSGLTLVALICVNLPSVISAIYSERASRDIRNGTVIEKARQGAVEALADTGVVEESHPSVMEVREESNDGRQAN